MFNILAVWDKRLYERYLTLERNIKAKSNSFYDAFLDLQEDFLRYVLEREGVTLEKRKTCGELLRLEQVKGIFCDHMGLPLEIYNKMGDYVLKINAHKHKGEKHISLETVLSYTRLFHTVLSRVATTWQDTLPNYDEEYFVNIFAQFEKENRLLWQQLTALQAELESYTTAGMEDAERAAYETLTQTVPSQDLDFETQNHALLSQISSLKDLKLGILSRLSSLEAGQQQILAAVEGLSHNQTVRTPKSVAKPAPTLAEFVRGGSQAYIFMETQNGFQKEKKRCIILLLALMGAILLATIVSTASLGIYSTYSFFENMYFVCVACMLAHILRTKRVYPTLEMKGRSPFLFHATREGILLMGKQKKRYKVFLILSCIGAVLNVICSLTDLMGESKYKFFVFVFEVAVFVLSFVANYFVTDFFYGYLIVGIRTRLHTGEVQTIFYSPTNNTLMTQADFNSKFQNLKLPL